MSSVNGNSSLVFRRSPWKHLGLLLLGILMVVVSYLSTTLAPDPIHQGICWFGVVFFSLAVVGALRDLIRGGVAIVLDETGFMADRLRVGIIPWNQVAECYVVRTNRVPILCFNLKQPELFLPQRATQRLAKLNKELGYGDMSLSFVGLSPAIEQAVGFVRARGVQVRGGRSPL